jgi:hypothetical protein
MFPRGTDNVFITTTALTASYSSSWSMGSESSARVNLTLAIGTGPFGIKDTRCCPRIGCRHSFMYVAIVPVAVSFMLICNPPEFLIDEQMQIFCLFIGHGCACQEVAWGQSKFPDLLDEPYQSRDSSRDGFGSEMLLSLTEPLAIKLPLFEFLTTFTIDTHGRRGASL